MLFRGVRCSYSFSGALHDALECDNDNVATSPSMLVLALSTNCVLARSSSLDFFVSAIGLLARSTNLGEGIGFFGGDFVFCFDFGGFDGLCFDVSVLTRFEVRAALLSFNGGFVGRFGRGFFVLAADLDGMLFVSGNLWQSMVPNAFPLL